MLGVELMILKKELPRSNPLLSCLEKIYVGITSWNRFLLDTPINWNFIEAPVWEALNVIENLVGSLPIASIKEDITLPHIMRKLGKIELEMPSINKINELDRKIQGNLNRLDNSMQKNVKTMETIKSLDEESSRIEKIEEFMGATFYSIKTKKEETQAKEEPKFVYVPKVPRAKPKPPIAKRVETMKTLEETPIFNFNETPIDFPSFDFTPRSIFIRPIFERSLKTSCSIEELVDDLDDGSIETT